MSAIASGVALTNDRGFTLIEVLVAVALFALLATMAHLGLSRLVAQDVALEARAERFARLGSSLQLLEIDLLQALPRNSRDGLGGNTPGFRVQRDPMLTIEFTRTGSGAPMESGVNRVRYRFREGVLSRVVDPVLDGRVQPDRAVGVTLLDGLAGFDVEILDAEGRPAPGGVWPVSGSPEPTILPTALKVKLETVTWGMLERTLLVGG
jgi:general secretion pathway protein J